MDKEWTIYAIRCKSNGKMYIGSTLRIENRIPAHFHCLSKGKHSSKQFIEDYNKYGREDFEVYILEEHVKYADRYNEYKYINEYQTYLEEFGYNRGDRRVINGMKIQNNFIYGMPPKKTHN